MRELIRSRDLKTLFGGVAVAAAAGLMMGAAMSPDLNEGAMKAPQILLAGGGPRVDVAAADAGVTAYAGRIPDYVIGTDALRPAEAVVLAYDDRAEPEVEPETDDHTGDLMAYEAPPERQPARWTDEPREAPLYPSQRGNTPYGADLPPPPAPPSLGDEAVLEG